MNIRHRIRLLFRKDKEPYLQLKRILGFCPDDIRIYQTALRHKSSNQKDGDHRNNERLEFLGDAVLGTVVADILFEKYPNKQEGYLTTLRSKLVKRETLNRLAEQIGLDKLVDFSGRRTSAHNSYMNGNAFEAFVGAIYLDKGYKHVQRFIKNEVFGKYMDIEKVANTEENYKSKLIEWCQKYQLEIQFDIINAQILADNNTTLFTSRIRIENTYCGTGKGYTKKESHQEAAKKAYNHIKRNKMLPTFLQAKEERTKDSMTS